MGNDGGRYVHGGLRLARCLSDVFAVSLSVASSSKRQPEILQQASKKRHVKSSKTIYGTTIHCRITLLPDPSSQTAWVVYSIKIQ